MPVAAPWGVTTHCLSRNVTAIDREMLFNFECITAWETKLPSDCPILSLDGGTVLAAFWSIVVVVNDCMLMNLPQRWDCAPSNLLLTHCRCRQLQWNPPNASGQSWDSRSGRAWFHKKPHILHRKRCSQVFLLFLDWMLCTPLTPQKQWW